MLTAEVTLEWGGFGNLGDFGDEDPVCPDLALKQRYLIGVKHRLI